MFIFNNFCFSIKYLTLKSSFSLKHLVIVASLESIAVIFLVIPMIIAVAENAKKK